MSERRPFEETHPHLREFTAFLDELNKESERGAALIAGAMLDDLLERSIRSFLLDHEEVVRLLKGFNAPLGTLSARALVAFALGGDLGTRISRMRTTPQNKKCFCSQCPRVVLGPKRQRHVRESGLLSQGL